MFDTCEICGANAWTVTRTGAVRDGAFGQLSDPAATIARCGGCGVERLDERTCKDDSIYTGPEYRSLLREQIDAEGFYDQHDILQLQNLKVYWPTTIRGQVIADIGCAAGSFLDHVSGLAAETIAVEPCEEYHATLAAHGHSVFSDTAAASTEHAGRADIATSFSVIEHVSNPRTFLSEIASLLKPGGKLLVSTPNRHDALMDLLPDAYPAFFYRTVHRWYFDIDSLTACAESAGFVRGQSRVVQRFGLSNAMAWLRDRRPTGHTPLPHLDNPMLDGFWQSYLEQEGVGDYLYVWLTRRD